MELFKHYLWQHRRWVLAFGASLLIFAAVFLLYHLPLMAIVYPAVLCLIMFACLGIGHYLSVRRRHRLFTEMLEKLDLLPEELPEATSLEADDYRALAIALRGQLEQQKADDSRRYQEMLEYFTLWAHQIKTPIAAMCLTLEREDSALSRNLRRDLGRIESYVRMVLTFLRLGSDSTDYMFHTCELDEIVRPAVKKFAGDFIGKKLSLRYEPLRTSVLTDEKWLGFVVEQVLSNAVKYTESGGVSVFSEGNTLCIQDTGIGIAPEDLPRIFENGFTGFNGRQNRQSSGIGLYLCKRICERLGHEIRAESAPGCGTTISIVFRQEHPWHE